MMNTHKYIAARNSKYARPPWLCTCWYHMRKYITWLQLCSRLSYVGVVGVLSIRFLLVFWMLGVCARAKTPIRRQNVHVGNM